MPSFTTRCMLWAAVLAGALVVLDAAGNCPTLAVKERAPAQIQAGKVFDYRIRVNLPQKSSHLNATTLRVRIPIAAEVQSIQTMPKNANVTVLTQGSTLFFEGMREAKRYNFRVKVCR